MLTRVLSRGLFFRRGSQVDFTDGPLGDRKINVEDIKVVRPHADNVVETVFWDDGHPKGSETLPQKAPQAHRAEDPGDENQPVLSEAVLSRPDNARQGLDDPSNIHNASQTSSDSSSPYVFGDTTGTVMKGADEAKDADEVFQTPLHQLPFLGHSEDGSSKKQRFIEHFDDTPCRFKTSSPGGPPDIPAVDSRLTQGMLSDITEADEPNAQDISIQDSKPSPSLLHVRTLSFSSFGSPYPSSCFGSPSPNSPQFCDVTTTCVDSRVATSVPSPNHLVLAQTTAQSASHEVASLAEPPSSPDSSTSDLVPFVVEPLLSSYSVNEPATNEGLADERKNEYGADIVPMPTTTTSVVPSASTYADATNLALQHPEMASDILRRPLSSASASGCPSKFPTPSVSCSVSLQVVPPASSACTPMRASTPHTTERPNWALAPDVRSPGRPNLVMASKAHTAEHPNWALAKDGQKATAGRQSRSRSRGRGRSGTRPPSITRGAQAEQRTRRGGQGSDADRTEPAPRTIPTSAVVSPTQPPECGDALPAVPSQTADLEDGPQQWLNRVNSWVEQTSRGAKTCPGTPDRDSDAKCVITTPSSPKEPSSQPQCHSRTTTSGLNPHAPAWTPTPRARCQTPSDSDSAPPATQGQSSPSTSSVRGPFTFGVDADIDRLRDMLRNCGIQDREIDTSSIRDNLTTTGSTPARLEKTGGVAPNDDGSQENTVPCGTREASKTPGRLDTQGTLHPQPDVPRQGFEFTTPTRLGPPFSTAGPMLGRPSSFPQSLFATPPRLTFQRANTQYFRKEPGGPWISGYLDPNAPPSGPSFFPQPSPRPAAFPGSAPGSAHLSFSQSSRSFSRTCQPEPGRGSPSPFAPGAYKVHVNCAERGQDAPVPGAPASPFTSGVKRARQPTAGPSTFNFKSQRFA